MPLLADLLSDSDGDGDGSGEDEDDPEDDPRLEKRQRQTQKARMQRQINRALPSRGAHIEEPPIDKRESWALRLQKDYVSPRFFNLTKQTNLSDVFAKCDYQKVARERARVAMSLLMQVLCMIARMLTGQQESNVSCLLESVVLDDTSCHIRGQGDSIPSVHTVMNTIQTIHVSYDDGSCKSALIPTAYFALQSQKTEDLHAAYRSNLLLSSAGVGAMLKAIESRLPQAEPSLAVDQSLSDRTAACTWTCQIMCGDALKANLAVFNRERELLAQTQRKKRQTSLHVKCVLHQLCLVRRPLVLSVSKYWTSLVRLAHLFEGYAWRKRFALAFVQILRENFKRTLVESRPSRIPDSKLRSFG